MRGQILGKESKKKKKERKKEKKAGSGIQGHKDVLEGRYSTHIHVSVIWFRKKTKGEGQDTVVSPAPIHPEFNELHHCVYMVTKEANLVHLNLAR